MSNESNIVYLNGRYLPVEEATVSVMDRGFLFGDGVYEVMPVFGNKLLRLDSHLRRLQNSLNRISLRNPYSDEQWTQMFYELLDKNPGEDRAVYLHISRGAYPVRDLKIKPEYEVLYPPTVFAMIMHVTPPAIEVVSSGISVITVEDFRWNACDIKSTSLVGSVMLKQQASEAGVDDAILIKDGMVTEGTASNVFLVKDGKLITPPIGKQLLPGITRDLVIEIAENNAILVEQREIPEAELYSADEIWMSSSTREIAPVIKMNGDTVGTGAAGVMWKRVMSLYQDYKALLRQQ